MTNEDAMRTYEYLTRALRENALGWVVDQVSKQVALGRSVRRRIDINEGPQFQEARRRRSRTEFTSSEPYNHSDQLKLLVDAIEAVIVSTTEM